MPTQQPDNLNVDSLEIERVDLHEIGFVQDHGHRIFEAGILAWDLGRSFWKANDTDGAILAPNAKYNNLLVGQTSPWLTTPWLTSL